MDKIKEGKRVFNIEISALIKTRDALDNNFIKILNEITSCKGKLIIMGMGKPGHIATKLAATFASLGTPSFFINPAEAMHGDLGMVSRDDIVMVISYSGESDEIVKILPNIKMIGSKIIAVTGNALSTLARVADVLQVLPQFEEACYLGLAPTSSTTAELVYGDALAVVASAIYGFRDADFAKFHPAGSLGKKITLCVDDLMSKGENNPVIGEDALMRDAIVVISKKEMGMTSVIDKNGKLVGIITDGDLRRALEKGVNIYSMRALELMTRNPVTINKNVLAVNALSLMKERNISCLCVVEAGQPIGSIKIQNIISAGIY